MTLKEFIQDESGFLQYLAPVSGLITSIAGLFGGAPGPQDLMQGTRDNLQLDRDAKVQSQDLRGDINTDIKALKDISTANARKVGAFDASRLGAGFEHLLPLKAQFANVDRSAVPLNRSISQMMQLTQLANSAGASGTSGALGVEQLLAGAGSTAGQGIGQGLSDVLSSILSEELLGQLGNSSSGPAATGTAAAGPGTAQGFSLAKALLSLLGGGNPSDEQASREINRRGAGGGEESDPRGTSIGFEFDEDLIGAPQDRGPQPDVTGSVQGVPYGMSLQDWLTMIASAGGI